MTLFELAKIPLYCQGIRHRLEDRKDHETKVVDLTLKIDPFTAQHAAAMNQNWYSVVKRTLFRLNSGDPASDLKSVEFRPGMIEQNLICFASPDSTEASICLSNVKVTKVRAKAPKDGTGWVLLLTVSFGPVDKNELAYVNDWYTTQRFVTFEESQVSMDFDEPVEAHA